MLYQTEPIVRKSMLRAMAEPLRILAHSSFLQLKFSQNSRQVKVSVFYGTHCPVFMATSQENT